MELEEINEIEEIDYGVVALNNINIELSTEEIRSEILDLEKAILNSNIEGREVFEKEHEFCPVTHSFSEGIYIRELFIPKGTLLTGRIHREEHPNHLMEGEIMIVSESTGRNLMEAPDTIISKAGSKKVGYAITDVIWVTTHRNPLNLRDIEEIEKMIFADTYEEYDKGLRLGWKERAINLIKKI